MNFVLFFYGNTWKLNFVLFFYSSFHGKFVILLQSSFGHKCIICSLFARISVVWRLQFYRVKKYIYEITILKREDCCQIHQYKSALQHYHFYVCVVIKYFYKHVLHVLFSLPHDLRLFSNQQSFQLPQDCNSRLQPIQPLAKVKPLFYFGLMCIF